MNVKEFLKPDWKKGTLFGVLLLLFYLSTKFSENLIVRLLFWPMAILMSPLIYPLGTLDDTIFFNGILLGIPLTLLWLYFLSCLIISIYNKSKKK